MFKVEFRMNMRAGTQKRCTPTEPGFAGGFEHKIEEGFMKR